MPDDQRAGNVVTVEHVIERLERRLASAESVLAQITDDPGRHRHGRGYVRGLTEAIAVLRGEK